MADVVEVVNGTGEQGALYRAGLTPTGYSLPEGLTFEEWSDMGPPLVAMAQSANWWLGDWLRYGEHHYGEKYTQAVELTGWSVSTLKNAQWVADRIPPDERHPEVPFSTHKAVASLDRKPRAKLLRKAAEEGMSEYEVRAKVREMKAEAATGTSGEDRPEAPPRTGDELLRDALKALDRAIEDHDWRLVGEARSLVAEARSKKAATA